MHADEGQLRTLVDGELGHEQLRHHVQGCGACKARAEWVRMERDEVFDLLATLDHSRAGVGPEKVIARGLALRWRPIAKAAGFAVVFALAGAAYAAPRSPIRSLLARVLSREPAPSPAVQRSAAEPVVSGITVAPGDRMVIAFAAAQPKGEIRVRLGDVEEIEVRTTGAGAAFTAGEKNLSINNTGLNADFEILLPRSAPLVELFIGKDRIFAKRGDEVTTLGSRTATGGYVVSLH